MCLGARALPVEPLLAVDRRLLGCKRVGNQTRYPTKKFKEKEPKNLLVHNKLKTDHVGGTKIKNIKSKTKLN